MRWTIDSADFVKGFEKELLSADQVTLSAEDVKKTVTLSASQKKSLAQSMKIVYQPEFYGDTIYPLRQAIFPYYTINLDFHDENNKSENGYQSDYLFVVCDNNRIGMLIPENRKAKYGLTPEQGMIAYVKTNDKFFEYIESLLPASTNTDSNNFNYLLNAKKVIVYKPYGQTDIGTDIHQVFKCVRTLRSFMGKEKNDV